MKQPTIITSGFVKEYSDEIIDAINHGELVTYIGTNTDHLFGAISYGKLSEFSGGTNIFRVANRDIQDIELTDGRKLIIGQLYA